MTIDINHPKMRLALQMADITGKQQAILTNDFGGYDIKPMEHAVFTDRRFVTMVSPQLNVDENHIEEIVV